jgi:hypothetical protein
MIDFDYANVEEPRIAETDSVCRKPDGLPD